MLPHRVEHLRQHGLSSPLRKENLNYLAMGKGVVGGRGVEEWMGDVFLLLMKSNKDARGGAEVVKERVGLTSPYVTVRNTPGWARAEPVHRSPPKVQGQ